LPRISPYYCKKEAFLKGLTSLLYTTFPGKELRLVKACIGKAIGASLCRPKFKKNH